MLGPQLDLDRRRRRAARRHAVEDARRRSAGSSPVRRRYIELIENLAPAVHLHDRADAGRHRGRARRAARAALARGRRARRAAARATSTGCGPAIRRRSCRSCAATRRRRSLAAAALARARAARARDPAADRRARHLAPARHAVGRAHRRADRPCSCAALADVRAASGDAGVIVVVTGTGTDIGKTWVTAATVARAARGAASRSPRASRCSRSRRRRRADRRRPARGRDRRGPARRVPAAPLAARRDGAADGRRRARPGAVHDRRPRAEPRGSRRGIVLVESVGGVRSPIAADGDTVALADALAPALVVLVADAGLGHDQLVRLSMDALAPPRRRLPQPVRSRQRRAPGMPSGSASREGFETLTDLDGLVTVVSSLLESGARAGLSSPPEERKSFLHAFPLKDSAATDHKEPHEDRQSKWAIALVAFAWWRRHARARPRRARRRAGRAARRRRPRTPTIRDQRLCHQVHGREAEGRDGHAVQDRLRQPGQPVPGGDDRRQRGGRRTRTPS